MPRSLRSFLVLLLLILPISSYSQSLVERQHAFQAILAKEKTPEAKIKRAEALAKDKKSIFRVDAINYLTDEKSTTSGPVFVTLIKDPDIREFAIYGIGELGFSEATPYLIRCMRDDNRNTRGNAYRALQKLYPKDFNFEFHHDDSPAKRSMVVSDIEKWWKQNRERLKNTALEHKSDKEKLEAEQRWEKYGKEYLDRPIQ
jgi:hypothetical protein